MWVADNRGLALLEDRGSPFAVSAFRGIVSDTLKGWRDDTFAARTSDGTIAAIALLTKRGFADSVPPWGYGGVVSSRPLHPDELMTFLKAARADSGAHVLHSRQLESREVEPPSRCIGTASVVVLSDDEPYQERYARLARRSLKRARLAGASVHEAATITAFADLYSIASRRWASQYPVELISRLLEVGVVKIHEVSVRQTVVASLVTLAAGGHWMCWLAAQSTEGREISASYLAYDALFSSATERGVPFVNLGTSVAGGRDFKHHLGAVEMNMSEVVVASRFGTMLERSRGVASGLLRRVRRRTVT
jgi:CelD/BcsL family acetyltransferase involved in cellulose biosynthesis